MATKEEVQKVKPVYEIMTTALEKARCPVMHEETLLAPECKEDDFLFGII